MTSRWSNRPGRAAAAGLGSLLAAGLLALSAPPPAARASDVRIVQTNSRDSVIHLIDPETNAVVGKVEGVPVNHGAAASPDGGRLYFSSEAKSALVVVDGRTLGVVKEIPLAARPNNIAISKDGRKVYVGIMGAIGETGTGGIEVIDTDKLESAGIIETHSRVHNVYVTPDGRYVLGSTFGGEANLPVFDAATGKPAFALYPPRNESPMEGVRPIAFETNPDGSTKRLFVQISDFHGFTVVDFAAQKEVARIELPSIPESERDPGPFQNAPSHGIGVAPDQKTLWVASRMNGTVYAYTLPGLELLGGVKVGSHPDWVTFSPDSKYVYVANGGGDTVSVVDVAARREVKQVQVGKAPKRNITAKAP